MLASDRANISENVNLIVSQYLATPLDDGKTPAERHINRPLRTKLHLLQPLPRIQQPVVNKQETTRSSICSFGLGDQVISRNYGSPGEWRLGTIVEKLGKLHYTVKLDNGYKLKRHIDQLKCTKVKKVTFDTSPTSKTIPEETRRSGRRRQAPDRLNLQL
jgi:hypothetical protein